MNNAQDLTGYSQSPDTGKNWYDGVQPQSSGLEELKAAYDSTVANTALGSVERFYSMHEAHSMAEELGSPKSSVEDLNKKYPGLSQPFSEPTDPFTAGEIARRQYEKQQLEQTIQNGPQGKLYTAGKFAAGLIAHASDPIEMGLATITGGATEATLAATGVGAKLGFGVAAKTIPQMFATGAVEGTAVNAALEVPKWIANNQDLTPNSLKASAQDAILGGLAFGALKGSWGGLQKVLRPAQQAAIHNVTVGQLASDKVPNPGELLKDISAERSGQTTPEFNPDRPYTFSKITPETLKDTTFYAPKEGVQPNFKEGGSPIIGGEDHGPGLYVTDHPGVANGIAGSKYLENSGSIHELNLSELKLKPLEDVSPNSVEQAKSEGFDGIHYEVNQTGGQSHDPYNTAMIFDPQNPKITETDTKIANSEIVHTPSPSDIHNIAQKSLDHESDLWHDKQASTDFNKSFNEGLKDIGPQDYEKHYQDITKDLESQIAQHPDTPGLDQELAKFKEQSTRFQKVENVLKGAMNCLLRGG